MPIRFRCAYCNQLMGIAHRKAGTVVSCPKCQGQVVVPHPVSQAQPAPVPAAGAGNLFEQNDFPNLFNNPMPTAGPLVNASPPAAPPNYNAEVVDQGVIVGTGVFLSPAKIALLIFGAVFLAAGAFLLGFLIGRS